MSFKKLPPNAVQRRNSQSERDADLARLMLYRRELNKRHQLTNAIADRKYEREGLLPWEQ